MILVGTSHTYQYPGNEVDAQFREMILRVCERHGIQAIAEELSEEALAEKHVTSSICMELADFLSIGHRFVDPNRDQRRAMGVLQESDIRMAHFLSEDEEAIRNDIRASHAARENFWLRELLQLNLWPTLLVCGADHIESFSRTLREEQFAVEVAERDWTST